jgi:hypothetical protein
MEDLRIKPEELEFGRRYLARKKGETKAEKYIYTSTHMANDIRVYNFKTEKTGRLRTFGAEDEFYKYDRTSGGRKTRKQTLKKQRRVSRRRYR